MVTMEMKKLFATMPQVGTIDWIGIRSIRRAALEEVNEVLLTRESGLEGDHYTGKSGKRQITLIQSEHLDVVASIMKMPNVDPKVTRRNIVVSGINLLALKNKQFEIGEEIVLETTGLCHPCSRMEENLGSGGYNAMRGHGGITARVLQGGVLRKGDFIRVRVEE